MLARPRLAVEALDLRFSANAAAPDGAIVSGTGLMLRAPGVVDPADAEGSAIVVFMSEGQGKLHLVAQWTPRGIMDMTDGDHYRVTMSLQDETFVLVDSTVDYQTDDIGRPGCPCYHHCLKAEVDLRANASAPSGV